MEKLYSFQNGKYVIKRTDSYMSAFRHYEFWQDMTGDKLTMSMLDEIDNLKGIREESIETMIKITNALIESRSKVKELEQRLSDYGWQATESARHDYQQNNEGWK